MRANEMNMKKHSAFHRFHSRSWLGHGILSWLLICGVGMRADDLFIAGYGNNTVQKLDAHGNSTIYASGLNAPIGITFDLRGNLYVANWGDGNIFKYDPTGARKLLANCGQYQCMGLATDTGGNLFVARYNANDILRYDAGGNSSVFAASGLFHPRGLAFDAAGNLYAACDNNTIQKFNTAGVRSQFANTGLNRPVGLAFDGSGNLYAANYFDKSITKFDSNGQASFFASTGAGYDNPLGIAFDSAGYLYAARAGNSIIEFDTVGIGSLFAATVNGPYFIAMQPIPEPSTCALLAIVIICGLARRIPLRLWSGSNSFAPYAPIRGQPDL